MNNPKYILLISWLISVLLSTIISVVPIWSYDQAQVSNMFHTLITPASYAFSIWGLMYLSWIILWVYQAFFAKDVIQTKNASLLAAAQIISSLWLLPSQFLYIWTSLIVMYIVLYILSLNFLLSRKEHKYFKYTVDLFLGWIIVASLANTHLTLVAYNVYFYPVFLSVASLLAGTFIVLYLYKKYASMIPSFVFLWASIAIIASNKPAIIDQVSALCILTILWVLIVSNEEVLNKIIKKSYMKNTKK